ncbi:hypothetical protein DFS34DRAFT_605527 [Phlyctochytrium arcticum]|nr:hypothetical protein DFS34DRAFT_605527 [Phlyctochytrium arcticum]
MPVGSRFPPEIIAQIVRHHTPAGFDRPNRQTLIALCLVSRAWKDIAQPHLWREVEFPIVVTANQSGAFYTLVANPLQGRFVKKIVSHVQKLDSSNPFQIVANHCPNLTELRLYNCPLSNQDFCDLAEKCDKLTTLSLLDCPNITKTAGSEQLPF